MKILIVIDMQNDFIDGTLGSEEAVKIVDRVQAKVKQYLEEGYVVVYTRDTHTSDYLNTQEGKNLPVIHCVEGSHGWEISDKVYAEGCPVIDKPSFGSLELAEYAAGLSDSGNLEEIQLVGLCTDICVISNSMILKAKFPEIPIIVDASCCAGVTPVSHQNALEAMKMCQIKVINNN